MLWKNQYIEEDPRERQQFYWVSLFYFMTKTCIEDFGLKGEAVMRQAVRNLGTERGIRKRKIANARGMKSDLVTMEEIQDIYSDPRFELPSPCGKLKLNIIEPEQSVTKFYRCPNAEIWAILEGKQLGDYLDIGSIYCEEVHHYLFGKFDPAVQVNLCEVLAKGDDCCNFRVHLRKANQRPYSLEEYKEKSWEDFGDDVTSSINTMFGLHYYHYSNMVYNELGETILRKALRAWANCRGERLRELNHRKGCANNIDKLIKNGDLFMDFRFKKDDEVLTANEASLKVHRCVLSEILHDHDADHLAKIYCEEVYKGICETYNQNIEVEITKTLASCNGCCEIYIKK